MLNISKSTNPDDYEILIRKRGDNVYASYCPQLNYMIKGEEHEQVRILMKEYIENHINELSKQIQSN
ncbi:MAG: hypothetical protein A2X61_06080 [Ignavibacteria bacterium GWB2_35_12]|nr:MAG: hypothetical protein A2X63_13875 [Ignavibacteria bacterium GWA2_35_8]OGU39822.1 MAG: hypothetical protein A2X61_06080 [Ignavibacteria bacterium GWB2_35_12]OGU90020.1 MAG: hypothetical protein A2220_05240 [Ignavibacteria bacterium RIFOXYA2_FULL_35_10]OGV21452.1 MAG: hypothetical protein A2475_13660 [Ignavibacteria bacterium RIFOXYC2_FULL_35_21]